MSKPFETVFVTTKPPRYGDLGCVEQGNYRTIDGVVALVDDLGVPRLDKKGKPIQQKLKPDEDPRKVAYRLTKEHIPNRSGDFNRKIIYPDIGKY